MVERGHGVLVFWRQVLAHQPVNPLAAGHDDVFRPDLVEFAVPVIDHRHALGGIRRTVVHHAGNGSRQTHARRLAVPVQFLPVDIVEQHCRQGVIPLDGSRDHGLDEMAGDTRVAAGKAGQVNVVGRVFQSGMALVGNHARLDKFISGIGGNDVRAQSAAHGRGLWVEIRRHVF